MIRRPPRSTQSRSSAASDVYKRQGQRSYGRYHGRREEWCLVIVDKCPSSYSGGYPDYHTHTGRCGHAQGTAAEYVQAARQKGLPGIGISDHLPLVHLRDPVLTMAADQLEGYVEAVLELKERYPGYVLLGVEADYRPDTLD